MHATRTTSTDRTRRRQPRYGRAMALAAATLVATGCGGGSPDGPEPAAPTAAPPGAPAGEPAATTVGLEASRAATCGGTPVVRWRPQEAALRYSVFGIGPTDVDVLTAHATAWADANATTVSTHTANYYGAPVPPVGFQQPVIADPPADVFTTHGGGITGVCAELGKLLPLDDLWEQRGWYAALPPAVVDLLTVGGEPYAAPTAVLPTMLIVNPEVLDAHELRPPTSWDELLAMCAALDGTGVAALTSGTAWRSLPGRYFSVLNLRVNGAAFHRELLAGTTSWRDARVEAVFARWRELIDARCFAETATTNDYNAASLDVREGRAAMWLNLPWMLDFVTPDDLERLEAIPFPTIDPVVARAEEVLVQTTAAHADTADPHAARALVATLTSEELQRRSYDAHVEDAAARAPVDPRIEVQLPPVAAAGRHVVADAATLVALLEHSATKPYAASIQKALVAFATSPTDVDAVIEQLEAARIRTFLG